MPRLHRVTNAQVWRPCVCKDFLHRTVAAFSFAHSLQIEFFCARNCSFGYLIRWQSERSA